MATRTAPTWQEELAGECQSRRASAPVYNIVSDRRGGRTAWSATVAVQNQNIAARYWYDGQYLNNAKEDAAEVACTRMRNPAITSGTETGSLAGGWQRGYRPAPTSEAGSGEAREEEKLEPEEEAMPEGAIARVGEEILD